MSHEGSNMKTADVGGGPVALSRSNMKTVDLVAASSDILENDRSTDGTGEKTHKSNRKLEYRRYNKIKDDKWVFKGVLLSNGDFPERDIAIKVLGESEYEERLLRYHEGEVKKRMVREAKHLLELIKHPNIVQYIHSCAEERERIHILMELCDENTLEDRIRDLKKFSELTNPKYCKAILLHITQAIHYMHSRNPPICHRDIKPSNILFSRDEKVVKISDFGYSKKVEPGTQTISSTKSTGTDTHRAPETYADPTQKTTNCLSDVFSLGIVYFFVLSKGNHPFGETPEEQRYRIARTMQKCRLQGLTGPDGALARNLINSMLKRIQQTRPDATEILKHPYFWSERKIVSFYNKVVDHIDPPKKEKCLSKYGVERRQANVDDCIEEILAKNSCLTSQPFISENDEIQVHLFFCVADTIAGVKSASKGVNKHTEYTEEVREWAFNILSSSSFFSTLNERARFYIEIIARVPTALKLKYDGNQDSDSSNEDENKFSSGLLENRSDLHCPELFEEGSTVQPDPNPQDMTHVMTDLASEDDVFLLQEASKTVQRALQNGTDRELILHLSDFHVIRSLISAIGDVEPEDDIIFTSPANSEPSSPVAQTPEECNTVPAPCSSCTAFPLSDEFIPDKQMRAFKYAKAKIKEAVGNVNMKDVRDHARKLLEAYDELNLGPTSKVKESNVEVERAERDHSLLGKLNELKLRRAQICKEERQNLQHCLDALEKTGVDGLDRIYESARILVKQATAGCLQTWKECFESERLFHKQQCGGNCPCVRLVKMAKGISGDDIYDLIKFIRNKLVHFCAIKRSHEGDWMEQQEGILNFVASALPELLPHMFKVMREELKDFIDKNQQLESSFYLPDIKKDALYSFERGPTRPEADEAFERDDRVDTSIPNSSVCDGDVTVSEESCIEELAPHSANSTEDIGTDGGRIAVAGCFVEFEPGTFSDLSTVSVTATIDRSTWPEGRDVITPTLHVDPGKIREPATVRLSLDLPDDAQSPKIEVLTFVNNKWEAVCTCDLFDRFIEFKCANLSKLVACLVGTNCLDISRSFQTTLFFYPDFVVTTVHLQNEILSRSLLQSMETRSNARLDKAVTQCVTPLKINSEIEIRLKFLGTDDVQHFPVRIDQPMLSGAIQQKKYYIPHVVKERHADISIDFELIEKTRHNLSTISVPVVRNPGCDRSHEEPRNQSGNGPIEDLTCDHVTASSACLRANDVGSDLNANGNSGVAIDQERQREKNVDPSHNHRPSSKSASTGRAFASPPSAASVKDSANS